MRRLAAGVALAVALLGCPSKKADEPATEGPWSSKAAAEKELFATFHTNAGTFVARLFSHEAPKTVRNFVGLATGEREWKNPATGEAKKGVPLYNGTTFHRTIEGFMIQGGDPLGSGTGDPGYRFEDEVASGLVFDKPGLLAMANSGPNTNGCQFFITVSKPAHLNGRHTIFGEVIKDFEVVQAISRRPAGRDGRPVQPVVIEKIEISDKQP